MKLTIFCITLTSVIYQLSMGCILLVESSLFYPLSLFNEFVNVLWSVASQSVISLCIAEVLGLIAHLGKTLSGMYDIQYRWAIEFLDG